MPTDEELLAIKDRAAAQLMKLANVNGVGIGGRIRGGERIDGAVLKVFVTTKLPPDQLDPAELIPAEFEGVPTDVAVLPQEGTSAQTPTGKPEVPYAQVDTRRQRPLVGGCRMQVDLSGSGFGTLGCMLLAVGDPSKVYALTNWHVLLGSGKSPPTVGTTKAGQPTSDDSITKCCSAIVGKVAGGGRDGVRDEGLVLLDPGTQWVADILEIGPVKGRHTITPTEAGTHPAVRKRGARTGLTGGIVEAIGVPKTVDGMPIDNVMIVAPNADPSLPPTTPIFFFDHGDSGSMLVNEANEVVGLMFAIPFADPPPNAGFHGLVTGWGLPIDDMIKGFSTNEGLILELAVAVLPGVVNTVPGAAMVALAPEIAPALLGERAPAADAEPVRMPIAAMSMDAPPAAALAQLQRELDRSERGRALVTLWLSHQAELLGLINSNRRVATVWHRSGASALFQVLIRMLTQPELKLPRTLNGDPVSVCIERVCASLERFASPALKDDLVEVRTELPELGGHSLEGLYAALGAA